MSEDYKDIPTSEAARLATEYAKDAVLIVAIDDGHNKFQFTTYGVRAEAKVRAARLSEEFSKFLGCEQSGKQSFGDFREPMEAARIKEQRDKLLAALERLMPASLRTDEVEMVAAYEQAEKAVNDARRRA